MGALKYPHLFEPLKVRGAVFKNRIFSAPQGYYNVGPEGYPNADATAYFEAKARGGMASVCVGDGVVHSSTGPKRSLPPLEDPGSRAGLATLAASVSRHGCIASMELNHGGMFTRGLLKAGRPLYGPSAMSRGDSYHGDLEPILEMPEDIIYEIIESFGKAAAYVKSLGFGMVTIHGGHGWLLHQFMSTRLNFRKDKWGGSLENRMRFPIAVAESIRRAVGPAFPIEFRMSGAEWAMADDNGYDIDEGVRFAKALDGYVDIIHVSAGTHETVASVTVSHPSMFLEDGCNSKYAAEIKKHVKAYVATVGSFSNPQHMEQTLASGGADIIEVARQSLADPNLPIKARTGREDEIQECIRCMQCYRTGTTLGSHFCSINPTTSREREVLMAPPVRSKKTVLIAGGGIAGMQAAITAAERGHKVILCEKSDRLGGVLLCEEKVPFKRHLADYMARQALLISRAAIDVRLNTEVTPEYARSLKPNVIVAALGSRPIKPLIDGIDGANIMSAEQAYANPEKAGDKIVILGGGLAGIELAIYISKLGRKATIIEIQNKLTTDESLHTVALMTQVNRHQIDICLSTETTKITDTAVFATGPDGDLEFAADTVVYATGQAPLADEAIALHDCADEYFPIGDCVKPRNIMNATHTAFVAAYDIGVI
ncbi:MAG: FAD-dependent oxidoreductase [Clostridiales bacterium]|nr:FAD-dependent oxidoreductase [Clostridiales bacterium]